MPTAGEWFFKYLELGLKYWKAVLSILLFLASYGGYSLYDFIETTEKEKNEAIQEVAIGFQKVMTETIKPVKKPNSCNKCEQELQNHLKEYKKNLREFHGVK